MIHRIEISSAPDARASVSLKRLHSVGFHGVKDVELVDVYTIDKTLSRRQLDKVAAMLVNPVTQKAHLSYFRPTIAFDWVVETGFLPGVTDNIASTVKEMIADLLHISFRRRENVYSSQLLFIEGKLSRDQVEKMALASINPVIQRYQIKSYKDYLKNRGMGIQVPRVHLISDVVMTEVNLDISDEELKVLGKQGIANSDGTRRGPLALDVDYLHAIQDHFSKLGRSPTDIELESIAQTWSEHCKHTIFADPIDEIKNGLFKTYIKGATEKIRKKLGKNDFCASVFSDNSGAIEFENNCLITHKVETHNSPSALDPFGGAVTGIVGVNRDTIGFGLGAKPIANTYGFCFAAPDTTKEIYRDKELTQPMLSPRRILDGVVAGVNSGGNCSGIPTPQGFLYFDNRYQGKPLVFVGTIGLMPKIQSGRKLYLKKAQSGDYIVMVGGRVGLDGIHGATFSSEALSSGSPQTAVQIGDPITQKKLSDALVKEARDQGLYHSITDNGAGGLSCSVAEMAKESGGCRVELEKVPLKYPGLTPWQIWISESQERMTLAVAKRKWKQLFTLLKSRGVEATIIGEFTGSGKCVVNYNDKKIMDLDMEFLHNGLPKRHLKTSPLVKKFRDPKLPQGKNLKPYLSKMLSRLNITSFEFISLQYDHEVQGNSVVKPLQGRGRINGDTTIVRPISSSPKGIVLSQALYPTYSDVDTYAMAAASIDTAIRNVVSAGADPGKIALLDNFCWCSSTDPDRLFQLKQAAHACYDYAIAYQTPFISGKDSMFNDFKGYDKEGKLLKISVPPTLLISAISVVDNVLDTISLDAKFPGDLVYVLGETKDEMGSSEYFYLLAIDDINRIGNSVPIVDARINKKIYATFYKAVRQKLIASALSVGRGGLGVVLAKTALGGKWGMQISLNNLPGNVTRDDFALFSESQGRIVVTVAPKNQKQFEKVMRGNPIALLGKVFDKSVIEITNKKGEMIVRANLSELELAYKSTFRGF